jgi:thymidylate synthase
MIPNEFVWTGGDTHLYSNSIEATEELLKREPKELPTLKLNNEIQDIYGFRYEDIEIIGYDAHPNIKVDVAV